MKKFFKTLDTIIFGTLLGLMFIKVFNELTTSRPKPLPKQVKRNTDNWSPPKNEQLIIPGIL